MTILDHVWQNGHTWLSKLMFYLETISACAFVEISIREYITTVDVNEALSFLSTFILYIVYCFVTNKWVLKPKLKQSFLILFFAIFKFASTHSIIAKMSRQNASACTLGKITFLKMALNLNLRVPVRAHAQLSYIHTCASHIKEITDKIIHI